MTKSHVHLEQNESKNNIKVTVSSGPTPKTLFKRISVEDARLVKDKKHQDYWSIAEHTFREQAARTLQRAFRKKHHYEYKGKYKETLNGPLTMRFIKEPTDDKYLEHASHIKKGNWLKLDFTDPHFIRNIYKALRLGLIDSNQLATVSIWHHAIEFFQDSTDKATISEFSFEEMGPYDPASISYSTSSTIADFHRKLKELPLAERTYLTVDLPHNHEILFLLLVAIRTKQQGNAYVPTYLSMLTKYFEKTDTSQDENDKLLKDTQNLNKAANFDAVLNFLAKQFVKSFPTISIPEYSDSTGLVYALGGALEKAAAKGDKSKLSYIINNYLLLVGNMVVGEQNPSLVISPNYKKDEPGSPLLSMVLPTISSLYKLQEAAHREHTTYPELTVGQLSPRDLMYSLMKPGHNLRPVELVHPDVKHEEKPHGATTTPFMLTWHDYFHTWRNGANIYKDFFCYLIESLQKYKKFDMSTAIWNLTDMNISYGRIFRQHEKDGTGPEFVKVQFIARVVDHLLSNYFFVYKDERDHNLLIMIDMIVNREKWKKYIGHFPEDFFPKDGFEWRQLAKKHGVVDDDYHSYEEFHKILAKLKEIIMSHPQKDPYCAAIYYIIRYKLQDNVKGLANLEKINRFGLDKFFCWDRNGGICYHTTAKKDQPIQSIKLEDLCDLLDKMATMCAPTVSAICDATSAKALIARSKESRLASVETVESTTQLEYLRMKK